jgi:exodeoxyribonuclease V alpha subunit
MSRVADIASAAGLDPIDVALADLLARLAGDTSAATLSATAALVSRERRSGHPCIELESWAERPLADGDVTTSMPTLVEWKRVLTASPLVGDGSSPTPLVLDTKTRCYLHRYWAAEQRVAERVRGAVPLDPIHPIVPIVPIVGEQVEATYARLFPPPKNGTHDRQADAARAVLRSKLTLMSGGPGTGKTTTVARILAVLLSHDDTLECVLAAPTGKAAARLSESLREQAAALDVPQVLRDKLASLEARTIHRVLGFSPRTGKFRYDVERPLPCDVLVVDEASMVDLLLMDALLSAAPKHARLLLVGDKDQLASVEAGFVFGDLCEIAPSSSLRDGAVELDVSWRFKTQPGIAALAEAVRSGDAAGAVAALDGAHDDARIVPLPPDPTAIVNALASRVDGVVQASTPAAALAALASFRVLTPTRRGPHGVEALNRLVERELVERGHPKHGDWYVGRPVLVTQNDYDIELFNGDIGVAFPDEESGSLRVWFSAAGGLRAIAPGKLPPHETAWAMTVHKSQGSEFDSVVFVLPERESPLLTRELVYTAVTRARQGLLVYGAPGALAAAVERKSERVSGLRDLLASP